MKFSLLFFTIIFTSITSAETTYSNYINGLQNEFGNISSKKIVYLDRDIINSKLAKLNSDNEKKQSIVIQDFISNISGQVISILDASTLLHGMSANSLSAYVLKDNNDKSVCVIVPSNPNFNQIQSNLRILNWDLLADKSEFKNLSIAKTLPRETLRLISDLHETFHCLDDDFLPNSQPHGIDHHFFHRAETFAEVGALLYLKKKGFTDINQTRAEYRTVGSYMTGKYLTDGPFRHGPWGAVYSLQKAILSIDDLTKNDIPKSWNMNQLQQMAYSITVLKSLNSHEFYGISEYQSKPIILQQNIDRMIERTDFDYLRERFLIVKKTVENYKLSLNKAFLSIFKSTTNTTINNNYIFDLTKDCPDIDYSTSKTNLDQQIDTLRIQYYNDNKPTKGLEYLQLKNIFKCIETNS